MDWGMSNRIARIISPVSGHTVMLAVDHGYFLGPTTKLEDPRQTIAPLLPYADAIALTRGILRTSVEPSASTPIILRVSGGVSIAGPALEDEGLTTPIKEAVRLNVAAVAMSIFVGSEQERKSLLNLSYLISAGEEYGIPVMAITAVGLELDKRDARYLALSCRIAAELGAHLVKTYYCDGFEKVVQGCPVPLVIAGGPKMDTEEEVFQITYDALQQGAVGVDMGRNIWQSDHPVAMIKAIRSIVHEKATVKEACELFDSIKEVSQVAQKV